MNEAMDSVRLAWARTVKCLFGPFRLNRWLVIGFCAFLASCGTQGQGNALCGNPGWGMWMQGGGVLWEIVAVTGEMPEPAEGGNGARGPGGGGGGGGLQGGAPGSWDALHGQWLLLAGGVALLLGAGWLVLVTWLSSRGQMLFLDSLVRSGAGVAEPWRRTREAGERLFRVRLGLVVAMLAVMGVLAGGLAGGAWAAGWLCENGPWIPLAVVGALLLGGVALVARLLDWVAVDLLAPALYARGEPWRVALGRLFREVIAARPGGFVLFGLLRFLLSVVAAMMVVAGIAATCCLLWLPLLLPYVGTVLLLPIPVFFRLFPLAYLAHFGRDWQIFRLAGEMRCPFCDYDLRGNPEAAVCPECGAALA